MKKTAQNTLKLLIGEFNNFHSKIILVKRSAASFSIYFLRLTYEQQSMLINISRMDMSAGFSFEEIQAIIGLVRKMNFQKKIFSRLLIFPASYFLFTQKDINILRFIIKHCTGAFAELFFLISADDEERILSRYTLITDLLLKIT